MSTLSEYFLKSPSNIVQLELLEISHPSFSKAYRLVRNAINGVNVTLEDNSTVFFEYYPLQISSQGVQGDLDNILKIDFGDLGEVLPTELDRVQQQNGFETKPVVRYWVYRSDILKNDPYSVQVIPFSACLFGPVSFEISNVNFKQEGASFEAKAPALNKNRTGMSYSFEKFPMLKGFL